MLEVNAQGILRRALCHNRPWIGAIGAAIVSSGALIGVGQASMDIASCTPRWDAAASCPPGVDLSITVFGGATVAAFAKWDGGSGSALFVGGQFDSARCEQDIGSLMRCAGDDWSSVVGPDGAALAGAGSLVVGAMTVFDDGLGDGPALYVGGLFETADGTMVNNIARWDGHAWSALAGPAGVGVDGLVRAMAVHDDGTGPALYVGGLFQHAGGEFVGRIARWDGRSWSKLATADRDAVIGTSAAVNALEVHDDGSGPCLFVGGQFQFAGGIEVRRIAKWDGEAWHALPGPNGVGTNGSVSALRSFDDGSGRGPGLYVGGSFVWVGGTDGAPVTGLSVSRIARWDGAAWHALEGPAGTGTSGSVAEIVVFDDGLGGGPALYAGGNFDSAGGAFVGSVARWDGSEWSALVPIDGSAIGVGGASQTVSTLFIDDGASESGAAGPTLLAGGSFTTVGGRVVNRVARWNGLTWSALEPGDSSLDDIVMALAPLEDGDGSGLYAGGWFTTAGGAAANRVARHDGRGWSALEGPSGNGVGSLVIAIEAFHDGGRKPSIYVAGSFTTAGGIAASRIARWDGTEWSALPGVSGNGVSGTARALRVFDDGTGPALYVGGSFANAGGMPVANIARWNGAEWSALADGASVGLPGTVEALIVHDFGEGPRLVAGGAFDLLPGTPVARCAVWDGKTWTPLVGPGGQGPFSTVHALAAFDDGRGTALYAGGIFTTADGQTVNRIARWDGRAWSPLEGPAGIGVNNTVRALAVFDDGLGPALFAAGNFTSAGGVVVNRIAKWDGRAWHALPGPTGIGTDNTIHALAVHDDGDGPALYAGGTFVTAGGTISLHLARWLGCVVDDPPNADLNGDGVVDGADLGLLLSAWGPCDGCAADLNGDGLVNGADLGLLLNAWGS